MEWLARGEMVAVALCGTTEGEGGGGGGGGGSRGDAEDVLS